MFSLMQLTVFAYTISAFLSASTTRIIAAAKHIVAEFLIAQEESVYPIREAIILSPTNSLISVARGASKIIKRRIFKACILDRS